MKNDKKRKLEELDSISSSSEEEIKDSYKNKLASNKKVKKESKEKEEDNIVNIDSTV